MFRFVQDLGRKLLLEVFMWGLYLWKRSDLLWGEPGNTL